MLSLGVYNRVTVILLQSWNITNMLMLSNNQSGPLELPYWLPTFTPVVLLYPCRSALYERHFKSSPDFTTTHQEQLP